VKLDRSTGQPPLPLRQSRSTAPLAVVSLVRLPLSFHHQSAESKLYLSRRRALLQDFSPPRVSFPRLIFHRSNSSYLSPHLTPKTSCPPWSRDHRFCSRINASATAKPPSSESLTAVGFALIQSPPHAFP
jgi:hypothetical protein